MPHRSFLTRSALGLCLAFAPGLAGAETATAPNTEVTLFVPLVQDCVSAPSVASCQQVRAVIAECAGDFVEEGCSVLLSEPSTVFADPARLQTAQAAVSETARAIAAMTFADVDHAPVDEASRADAERTLLLGDENLMAHSAPPLLDGDETAAEAAAGASTDPIAD